MIKEEVEPLKWVKLRRQIINTGNQMQKTTGEEYSIIDQMNTWPFACMIGMGAFFILTFQSMWNFVSGLYFPYAYEAIFIPYFMYLMFSLASSAKGDSVNKARHFLLLLSVVMLFTPSFYLLVTNQVDARTAIFGDFNPALEHMPYASTLPVLFYLTLLAPIKDFLK